VRYDDFDPLDEIGDWLGDDTEDEDALSVGRNDVGEQSLCQTPSSRAEIALTSYIRSTSEQFPNPMLC
jgi:hypothetical protein